MKAQVCVFKRDAKGGWTKGIMIGINTDESKLVIDQRGDPVTRLYDFRLAPELGCFELKDT